MNIKLSARTEEVISIYLEVVQLRKHLGEFIRREDTVGAVAIADLYEEAADDAVDLTSSLESLLGACIKADNEGGAR